MGPCGEKWEEVAAMPLTGTYSRAVDQKGRLPLPRPLREAMKCTTGGVLYLAPGTDGSLALYTEEAFTRLAERVDQASPASVDVRAFTRLFYARAHRLELDQQGRIRIPAELAELVELGKDAVLLGVQDHVEIWPTDRWKQYLAERHKDFDKIAEAALRAVR